MAYEAILFALPTINRLAVTFPYHKGPQGVVLAVCGEGLSKPVTYIMLDKLGPKETWSERWGAIDFEYHAVSKAETARRTGAPNRKAIEEGTLKPGETKYYGGVAEDTMLGCGVSGLTEHWDQICAWILWNIVDGLRNS